MASIEQIYQKKTQLEHILLRPDTYVGSVEYTDRELQWVYDAEQDTIVQREISYVPGLYKIFDEILVNAADNKQRDPKMNTMRINIDKENNEISVYNNGRGIPVVMHKHEKLYVPELIFGTLLTSSNYNDGEKKVTGGRNGFGAKLCNIFSTKFTLETSTKEYGKKFKQTWVNNMTKESDCEISKSSGEDFTKITFTPDLAKFKMTCLDDDIIALMCRRAYDVAGSSRGVNVYLNGKAVPVKGFKQYVEFYMKSAADGDETPKLVHELCSDRWEVALAMSDKGFQQVSFANSIATTKGGRHVDHVTDQIVANIIEVVKKKTAKGGFKVKPFQIKNHMWVFVNALIENPTFDSQTKETMTLQSKSFGSTCKLSDKFFSAAAKCGIVESVISWVNFKQLEQQDKKCSSKKTSKLKGIPKLDDANDAGTRNSHLCTLILTEGDSAKTLAVSGLGVVGRDRYGVFPMRGKMLNVREASIKQISDNVEVNALLKIIGLQYKLKYESDEEVKTLRYGKIMIMADQDQDGSHIKGLVINFIHNKWPALIRRNFIEEFITPIIKATKGREELSFFSIPEYVEFRNNTDNWQTYRIKYYKGLGTSTSKEAKEYFSDMVRHRIKFEYSGPGDDDAVDLAFSKKKIEERKVWLTRWMEIRKERREQGLTEDYLYDKHTRAVTFTDFINKELILFSNTDNERSIPSLVDGLKPGQRKVMFTCFKRADKKEVKVAQLAGAVGEMSAYHHGEQSLMMTIVNLAQDYVGSNNINLLLPIGQFGTRLQGGKDSASPRYIFTQVNPVTKALFPSPDENVLRFLYEENQRIEPEWYCPIIPTILVNGAEGIGTGWSTKVPNFNPREIVENMRRLIRGEEMKSMVPWYKHFRGTITQLDEQRYVSSGEIAVIDSETIEITELPVKTWTQNYKESVLEPMMENTDKSPQIITDFKEYHTDQTVKFVIKMTPNKLHEAETEGLHKVFKLQTVIHTTSMVLFDASGCLRKFNSPAEICLDFFATRKNVYIQRKAFLEGMLRAQSRRLSNQARFIMAKINGEIVMENKRKATIVEQLVKHKFDADPVKKWKEEQKKKELEMNGEVGVEENEEGQEEEADQVDTKLSDYDYLVGMAMIKLSEEEKDKLLRESEEKLEEVRILEAKTWDDLWHADIDHFLEELDKQEKKEKSDIDASLKNAEKRPVKEKKVGGRAPKAAKMGMAEIYPNPDGVRVAPTMDAMKEKYEQKPKREKKVKEEGAAPKRPRVKKEETDTKQKTAKKPAAKKKTIDSSDEESDAIELSDESDSSEPKPKKTKAPPAKKEPITAATKKEPTARSKKEPKEAKPMAPSKKKKTIDSSDEESDAIELSDESDSSEPKPKKTKAPPAKKEPTTAATKKEPAARSKKEPKEAKPMGPSKRKNDAPAKAPAKKAKKIESEDDDDDDIMMVEDVPTTSRRPASRVRAAAAKTKIIADMFVSDDEDEEFVFGAKGKGSKQKVIESDDESDYEMSD